MIDCQGSEGFMTNNLWFNGVCSLGNEDVLRSSKRSLKVKIIQRTHPKCVFAGECLDSIFLLASVVVAEVNKKERLSLDVKVKFAQGDNIDATIDIERLPKAK